MVLSIYGLCLTCFNLSWHDSPNGLILFEMPWNHHQHLWRPWSKPEFQLRSTHSHHIHCFVGVICISASSTLSFGWFVPILHSETTIFPLKMAMGKKLLYIYIYIYSSSTNFGWIIPLKKKRLSIFGINPRPSQGSQKTRTVAAPLVAPPTVRRAFRGWARDALNRRGGSRESRIC